MELKSIGAVTALRPGTELRPAGTQKDEGDFGSVLQRSLAEVNRLQGEADAAVEALATNKGISLHDTMIALEKADLSFRLMMQVRNKIVQAYRDVLNMQV